MLAIVDAYRAGLFKLRHFGPNLTAGLIVGVVALPLAMAFAIASGAKPEQGLYTAIIAALCVAIFGGSRVQVAGPTGAFVVILANITAQYGIVGLQIASLLAGIILLCMGLVRLGSVIKFIPAPVIVGFTAGIGVIIFVGEWKNFFGLSVNIPLDADFHQKLLLLISDLPNLNLTTTGLACLSLLLVLVSPKIVKGLPGPLVAMVVVTALQAVFHFEGVVTIGSAFGEIPRYLPRLQWPDISFSYIVTLIGPAFSIALLGAIESLLSATAADGMVGTKHDSNQELIGQGIANIMTPLFGGFAATGAIARTATNIRNGGNSPLSAITHSLVLVMVVLLLAPLASNVPLCALAAILFVVAYNMSDIPYFIFMLKRAPKYDIIVQIVTFLLTVFTNLVIAVNVGVILAMLFFVRRMNQSMQVEQQTSKDLQNELADNGISELPKEILVCAIQGPFFFGVAEKIERLLPIIHAEPKTVIFRLKDVPFIDMTGLETFHELISQYCKRGIRVFLCEANTLLKQKIDAVDIGHWIEEGRIFSSLSEVLQSNVLWQEHSMQ